MYKIGDYVLIQHNGQEKVAHLQSTKKDGFEVDLFAFAKDLNASFKRNIDGLNDSDLVSLNSDYPNHISSAAITGRCQVAKEGTSSVLDELLVPKFLVRYQFDGKRITPLLKTNDTSQDSDYSQQRTSFSIPLSELDANDRKLSYTPFVQIDRDVCPDSVLLNTSCGSSAAAKVWSPVKSSQSQSQPNANSRCPRASKLVAKDAITTAVSVFLNESDPDGMAGCIAVC